MNRLIQKNILTLSVVLIIMIFAFCIFSCRKLVNIAPPSYQIADNNVYSSDATAIAVLTGMYTSMNSSAGPFTGTKSIHLLAGLGADELIAYSGSVAVLQSYYQNSLTPFGASMSGTEHWSPLYNYLLKSNAVIEGLTSTEANALTPAVKQQLLGEAKFMRAFFYFYLINLFGDVPLALTTDPKINALLGRAPLEQVYEQIINDLNDAKELLSSNFLDATLLKTSVERVRPTKFAAEAFLARVYLYTGEWAKAEEEATEVISNTALFNLSSLNNAFLKASLGNKEAIWQLQPTTLFFNTQEAINFIIPQTGPNNGSQPVYLSRQILKSFEAGDNRAKYGNWVDTTIYKVNATTQDTVSYVNKYKLNVRDTTINASTGTAKMKEFLMMLRLGEQYLIRAEARAHLGKIPEAQSDLNTTRARAGLPGITPTDKTSLLAAILKEKQVELFCESGHRWLDLKRTGNINAVMSLVTPLKANGAPWQLYQAFYPLPQSDLDKAPNLVQNLGY
ncbi:MAG TPA: RagB/SusD family nutrient uptake outer membrane protein [Niastella sp.]